MTELQAGENNIQPSVFIIIVTWEAKNDIVECLYSLKKLNYPNYKIVVVDNASKDGTPRAVKSLFPDVILIENKENLGFAEGNNIGIRFALKRGAHYILLLNDDTVVHPTMLKELIKGAEMDDKNGIGGGKIYYYSDEKRIWFAGGKIDKGCVATHHIGNEIDNGQYNEQKEVDYITGCMFLIKAAVIKEIGLLDSRFFMYREEIDWCLRAKKAGFKIIYFPEAIIWHKGNTSLGGRQSAFYLYYMTRNGLLIIKKHNRSKNKAHSYILFAYHNVLKELIRILISGKNREKLLMIMALKNGVIDFLFQEYGKRY